MTPPHSGGAFAHVAAASTSSIRPPIPPGFPFSNPAALNSANPQLMPFGFLNPFTAAAAAANRSGQHQSPIGPGIPSAPGMFDLHNPMTQQLLLGMMRQQQQQRQQQLQQTNGSLRGAINERKRKLSPQASPTPEASNPASHEAVNGINLASKESSSNSSSTTAECRSLCREDPCSPEALVVSKWSAEEVCKFVDEIDLCRPFTEVNKLGFRRSF